MTSRRAGKVGPPWRGWRIAGALLLAASLGAATMARAQPPEPAALSRIAIGYAEIAGDRRYEPVMAYARMVLKRRERPFAGAELGIDDAKAQARAAKVELTLERITAASAAELAAAVVEAHATRDVRYFIVDAPAAALKPLAEAVKGRDLLLFNATAADDALRRDLCAAEVVHTLPSLAMQMDALVQYLVSRKWGNLLVLEGPLAEDAATVKALENSARKFGARVVARREFKPGTDPREREKNDPALLSAGTRDYDVAFVADHAFEFARQVPYHMVRARPVVGAIDLEPLAWHWTFERHGAPQLNSRFDRRTGRHMDSADWAAWIAVKMVAQAALRTGSAGFAAQRKFILGDGTFDGGKGLAVSVRPWDHQLRQAVLLAAPYAVVARAPVEGFLHRTNELDTLGDDAPETPCRLNR
jgi:ABC transporter substrate binding protein (PQQ-dependent alcohol dehydrogenase system)